MARAECRRRGGALASALCAAGPCGSMQSASGGHVKADVRALDGRVEGG